MHRGWCVSGMREDKQWCDFVRDLILLRWHFKKCDWCLKLLLVNKGIIVKFLKECQIVYLRRQLKQYNVKAIIRNISLQVIYNFQCSLRKSWVSANIHKDFDQITLPYWRYGIIFHKGYFLKKNNASKKICSYISRLSPRIIKQGMCCDNINTTMAFFYLKSNF